VKIIDKRKKDIVERLKAIDSKAETVMGKIPMKGDVNVLRERISIIRDKMRNMKTKGFEKHLKLLKIQRNILTNGIP
jgi:exonuclease III